MKYPATIRMIGAATVCLGLIACTQPPSLLPPPASMVNDAMAVYASVPTASRSTAIDVIYVTRRKPRLGRDHTLSYSNGESDELRFGVATSRFGEPDMTWDELIDHSITPDWSDRPAVRLKSVEEHGIFDKAPADAGAFGVDEHGELTDAGRAFADLVNTAAAEADSGQLLIYVHGFMVDFPWSMTTAAQLHHYLGRRQPVLVYAWPARQDVFQYAWDAKRARRSVEGLGDLLSFLSQHTQIKEVDLLAHSSGAAIVAQTLQRLRQENPGLSHQQLQHRYRIGQIVYVAADIDVKRFVDDLHPAGQELASRTTIYFNADDFAMTMSRLMHFAPRLGDPNIKALTPAQFRTFSQTPRLEMIDAASSASQWQHHMRTNGHDYWLYDPWTLSDILLTISTGRPAERRGLLHAEDGRPGFVFPTDYPDAVVNAIHNANQ